MPTNKRISEMATAATLGSSDLIEIAQSNAQSSSGYVTAKTTLNAVANEVNTEIQYAGLSTTAKTIVGAINEAASTGGGGYETITGQSVETGNTIAGYPEKVFVATSLPTQYGLMSIPGIHFIIEAKLFVTNYDGAFHNLTLDLTDCLHVVDIGLSSAKIAWVNDKYVSNQGTVVIRFV